MRTLWVILFAIISTFFFALTAIISGIFNPYSKFSNAVVRTWARSILWASGIRVHINGPRQLRPNQPAVYMANHQSAFDILATVVAIPGTVRFIAKKELFRIPVFAQGMRRVGMISIDRGNSQAAQQSLAEAAEKMKKGVSVIIFPEGTRSRDGQIHRFKKGGFVLAIKGQFPIIPTVIKGSFNIMKKKSLKLSKGQITVDFLPAVSTAGMTFTDRNALHNTVSRIIAEDFKREK